MRNIIAFTGRAGSGKDYQCNILAKGSSFNKGYIKIAFADSLRHILRQTLNIKEEEFNNHYEEWKRTILFNNQTLRDFLEHLGSSIRYYQSDFFVDALISRISKEDLIKKDICISDLRYLNEFHKLKNYCSINGYNFKLIFCDFHSDRYQEHNDHESARLSNFLVKLGCKDLQEVTEEISKIDM